VNESIRNEFSKIASPLETSLLKSWRFLSTNVCHLLEE
jgi:hypothetical protein